MTLPTLYARREPTTDEIVYNHVPPYQLRHLQDIVLYHDREATRIAACYRWDIDRRPRRKSKSVMHQCARYSLAWLDPLPKLDIHHDKNCRACRVAKRLLKIERLLRPSQRFCR